jgi:N-acetylglutamate synthase-like GNAT family acetyltransferase
MRSGAPPDAEALYALIDAHRTEGHLLPRDLADLRARAARFVVCEADGAIRACAELAPLSAAVAEVRSLVVSKGLRGTGLGAALVDELCRRAAASGFETLSAFTHDARFFVRQGFALVPHPWVPDKIARDCAACPLFRRCGQHAVVRPLKEIVRHGLDFVEDRSAAVA